MSNEELLKIKNWPVGDFMNLIDFIRDLWNYNKYIKQTWYAKARNEYVLKLELCTVGWSDNEDIINALLENTMFVDLWYSQWHRGGKYVFDINPTNVGFKMTTDYVKENNVSRQYIHRIKDRFDSIKVSENKVYIRKK